MNILRNPAHSTLLGMFCGAALATSGMLGVLPGLTQDEPDQAPEIDDHASTSARYFGDLELAIWNDPVFKRRFTESYLAETDVEPTVTALEIEEINEIRDLIADERIEKAKKIIARNLGPAASAIFDYLLANIHFQAEELEDAERHYRHAIDKYPKFRRAWKNLGLVHVQLGQHAEAALALARVIELGGNDAITYGMLGITHSTLGNSVAAETAFRTALMLDPATLDWKLGLARSLFLQSRYQEAAALSESLIATNRDEPAFWLLQANAYIGMGETLKAAENYEMVNLLGGATEASLSNLADIYVNEGLHGLAVDPYLAALELAPDAGIQRPLKAVGALIGYRSYDEALRLVEGVEQLREETLSEEDRTEVLRLRARIAVATGAGEEQAAILEQIVEADPMDGDALILLGQHHGRQGEVERAAFYFERAASIEAFEADAKVRHAQLLVDQGRYADAVPLLQSAQAIEPRENVQVFLEQVDARAKSGV